MDANPKIIVVLSDDLLCHLRTVAQEQHIPQRWLVAGLRHLRVRDRTDDESPGFSHGTLTFASGEWRLVRKCR